MKTGKAAWTIKYSLLNSTYFIAFCTIHAYAAVFLLAHGFTNTQVGILLALANISSAVCQPLVAALIDKPGPVTNRGFIIFSVLAIMAGSGLLMLVNENKVIIFIVYALIYMIQFTYQPVMTALCFEYQNKGADIMYGLSRGLGSAGFAVTSMLIGGVVEKRGVFVLLIVNVFAMAASLAAILLFRNPAKGVAKEAVAARDHAEEERQGTGAGKLQEDEETDMKSQAQGGTLDGGRGDAAGSSLREFAKMYPAYAVFLVAVVCFFFAHNMINDFMIQIIRELGGAEKELGTANFLQAILELPVMAMIGVILKKISARKLLLISGVAFLIKIVILIFAKDMTAMYISQSFQLLAYALFIPAAAYYVSETMRQFDQVKGQAFITTAITVGGIFSNFISGRILDSLGVKAMLITGTMVCAVGVVIAFMALGRKSAAS